jgi:hypothetical protein
MVDTAVRELMSVWVPDFQILARSAFFLTLRLLRAPRHNVLFWPRRYSIELEVRKGELMSECNSCFILSHNDMCNIRRCWPNVCVNDHAEMLFR